MRIDKRKRATKKSYYYAINYIFALDSRKI